MSNRFDPGGYGYDPISRVKGTYIVKILILACTAIYIMQLIARLNGDEDLINGLFGMVPAKITEKLFLWQFLTAMFLHGSFLHLVFNMIGLFFFGP